MPAVFCIAAILVGCVILALPAVLRRRQIGARAWPQTRGVVVNSKTEAVTRQSQGFTTAQSYVPRIEYRYTVDGTEYTGTRYSFAWTQTKAQADAAVARHPIGVEVVVYYDPADPRESVLSRNASGVVGPFVFGGLLFLFFGVGGLFVDYPALLERFGFN